MPEYRVQLQIRGDTAQAQQVMKELANVAKASMEGIATETKGATNSIDTSNRSLSTSTETVQQTLKRTAQTIRSDFNPAVRSMRAESQQASSSLETGLGGAVSGLSSRLLQLGAGIAILQRLRTEAASTLQITDRFKGINAGFMAITGGGGSTYSEMEFARKAARDLSSDLLVTTDSYMKLAASSRGTALQGQPTRDIFLSIGEAASVLNLTLDQEAGAYLALSQMMSKGTVQAEELKGQLGERLPGAFQLAAQAMGMTTAELQKQLEEGKILAEDLLPKLARVLHERYGDSVAAAANSSSKAMNRLNNELTELKLKADDFTGASKTWTLALNEWAKEIREIGLLGSRFGTWVSTINSNWSKDSADATGPFREWWRVVKLANEEASRMPRQTYGQESFAGIGGGSEGPRPATWSPPAPDRETIEAQEAYNNDLAAAETRTRAFKSAHDSARAALKTSGSALDQYNAKIREYDDLLAKGANPSDIATLKKKASEDYQKAIEREAKAAENASKKEAREAQKAARESHDYKVALIRHEMDVAGVSAEQKVAIARRVAEEEARFHGATSDDAVRAQRLITQAEKARDEERARIREIEIGSDLAAEKAKLDIRRSGVETDAALGRITAEQRIQQLSVLTQAEIELERNAMQQRQALRQQDPVEQARIDADLKELANKRNIQLAQSENQLKVQTHNRWKTMADGIASTWSGAIKSMLFSTQSWKDSVRNVLQGLAGNVIDGVVKRMTNAWLLGEQTKTGATAAGEGQRQAIQQAGTSQGLLAQAAAGLKTISNDAYKAAAGAYSATSEIPLIGPILAPAAAAAAFAAVLAFGGGIASAAGGWQLPSDQLLYGHKKEVVMPVPWVRRFEAISDMATAGAGAGGGNSSGGDHFHFHCIDGASVQRMVKDHGRTLAQVYKQAKRAGVIKAKS